MTNTVGGGRHHLGTIEESGLSNTQLTDLTNGPGTGNQDVANQKKATKDFEENQEEDGEEFVYPGAPAPEAERVEEEVPPRQPNPPSPAQLESLYAAASSGDLPLLKKLFRNALQSGDVEPFGLANDASTRTGFTALHAAASRGYLNIVTWLIEDCGAMPDLEDREGETALHKAALNGHLPIIQYLLPNKADVHARDADGWTALHNACSKGYLDIVRWLCENGGAASVSNGVRGVDIRSKDGWTPLMNASSKGHLPVVHYLLSKQSANPLVRNNWGETAYDAAAAVFEVWICEVLQQAEAERWRGSTIPYNPLAVHTTVPLILYENQRLDTRLKTVAVSGGRPKFSAAGLGRHGRRPPFELKLPTIDMDTGVREVAAWRSDVQLPLRVTPWVLPKPEPQDRMHDGAERSYFWLSDWTLDVTHPGVDAEEGWQYAHFFSDPDDQWTAEKPPQLERLLTGAGVVGVGLPGSMSRSGSRSNSVSSSSSHRAPQTWVRRRRWVRIMRRRLDIPPLPFLEPDGSMYHVDSDGTLIRYVEDSASDRASGEGQELGSMPATFLSSAQDYVARSRYLVGTHSQSADPNAPISAIEARRAIAKLERATMELRQGILGDEDMERKTQAEVLLNAYSRELERRRLTAGTQGLLLSGDYDDLDREDDDDDDDDEFHYPGSTAAEHSRPASRSSHTTEYSTRPGVSRAPTDLTPQLSQAPDFRVPTHEAPQKVLTPRWTSPTPHQLHPQWERDEAVNNCRDCQRRFNFLTRRHVGPAFTSPRIDQLMTLYSTAANADVYSVTVALIIETQASASSQRVCQMCFDEVNAGVPGRLFGSRTTSLERIVVDQARLTIPGHLTRGQSGSQLSDLAECPVCNKNLDEFGSAHGQESHVKACLEGDSGATPQAAKYLVYRLPAESALLGVECVICLEEFTKGSNVARLSCFCSFHNACLSSWLQRGKSCPVHAR
ncbi:hypothetical protein Hypma_010333 [Hypsizygus marmoreus]|uniref:RING-type domain-containing protein n=1 Tax=Hypsizygus marmoreus TaxID=39966 RepID=A0A369JLB4_HYPMA|nr:hypothetical protein Hypma_010333 [Hypsizygus marmoreus]